MELDRDISTALIVLAALRKAIATEDNRLRALIADASPGDRIVGRTPNDHPIGHVVIRDGSSSVVIDNPEDFTDWVADTFPDETQIKVVVRPAFERRVLQEMRTRKAAQIAHPTTGEILDVPGARKTDKSAPSPTVNLAEDAITEVLSALRAGALTLPAGEQAS